MNFDPACRTLPASNKSWRTLAASVILLPLLGCGGEPVGEITPADPAAIRSAPEIEGSAGDWPWWRGPNRDGHAAGKAPTEWGPAKGIAWKTNIPGRGHASPIVWGEQVFVATADETRQTQSLLCLDRQSGDILWTRQIHQGGFARAHHKNSQASATPACDGERVYAVFLQDNAVRVTAVDLAGKIVWRKSAGGFASQHGYGSSPLLYKSLVIVAGDSSQGAFLAALDRETGKLMWRTGRPNDDSFGTPILGEVAGRTQLLHSGQNLLTSYDPATGEVLWESEGPARSTANTVAFAGDLVFAAGGNPENNIFAVKADGSGEIVWRKRMKVYVPSLLAAGGKLLAVNDDGVGACYDAETGKEIWRRRLGGNYSASPVLADGNVYLPREDGSVLVFEAGDKYKLIAENRLAGGGMATPAIGGGRIYLRTDGALWCIGEKGAE